MPRNVGGAPVPRKRGRFLPTVVPWSARSLHPLLCAAARAIAATLRGGVLRAGPKRVSLLRPAAPTARASTW